MAIVKKEVERAEELGDVMELIENLIVTIKNKDDYMGLIPALVAAVNGADEVPAEIKADLAASIKTATDSVIDIALIFAAKEETAEVAE